MLKHKISTIWFVKNSLHVSDIIDHWTANIDGIWNTEARQVIEKIQIFINLKQMCKYVLDQHLIVLKV